MKKVSLLLMLFVALLSCKKTVEEETSTWKDNKKKIKELQVVYPSFAGVLDEEMKDAQQKWDQSTKITQEEDKIMKMSEANYTFVKGFVYDLGLLSSKIESITLENKNVMKEMVSDEVELSRSDRATIALVNDDTKNTLSNINKVLKRGDKSVGQASKTIKDANKGLVEIEQKLADATKIINKSKEAQAALKNKKKAIKDKKKDGEIEKTKKDVEAEKIK